VGDRDSAFAPRTCAVPSLAGRAILDRTTEALLKAFSREYSIEDLPEDKRFEHFSAFSMIRRHYIHQRSEAAVRILWDSGKAEELFKKAAALIDEITGGELDRDTVRTEAVTKAIIDRLRPRRPPAANLDL
jgi:hypothetical protein